MGKDTEEMNPDFKTPAQVTFNILYENKMQQLAIY